MKKTYLTFKQLLRMLTPCTAKMASKRLATVQEELLELMNHNNTDSSKNRREDEISHSKSFDSLKNEEIKLTKILNSYTCLQDKDIEEQAEHISLGNGVTIKLLWPDKKAELKKFFYDSICIGPSKHIVSMGSPLGETLFGKKVGNKGSYKTPSEEIPYEVIEITPYTEAKKLLKQNRPEPQVVEEEVLIN